MQTKPLEVFKFTPLCAAWRPMGEGRPEGLHLSDIIYGPMYEAHFGKKSGFDDSDEPNPRMQMGFLWERAIDHVWTQFMKQQPLPWDTQVQVERDGIHMTPDGVAYEYVTNSSDGLIENPLEDKGTVNVEIDTTVKRSTHLIEAKATWRTLRKWEEDPEEEFITWFWQVKAYCHALGLNRCQFYIFWVNGDYKYAKGRGPIVVTQEFEFTDEELENNWTEILGYAKLMKEDNA